MKIYLRLLSNEVVLNLFFCLASPLLGTLNKYLAESLNTKTNLDDMYFTSVSGSIKISSVRLKFASVKRKKNFKQTNKHIKLICLRGEKKRTRKIENWLFKYRNFYFVNTYDVLGFTISSIRLFSKWFTRLELSTEKV